MQTYEEEFVKAVRHCNGSLVTQYVKGMLDITANSIAIDTAMKMNHDNIQGSITTTMINTRQLQTQEAKGLHVTYVLSLVQHALTSVNPSVSNYVSIQADVFSRLIIHLSSAIILTSQLHISPYIFLQLYTVLQPGMSLSSFDGQLWFVDRECTVLMCSHGVELTNTLRLRLWTTGVEIQIEEQQTVRVFHKASRAHRCRVLFPTFSEWKEVDQYCKWRL